MVGRLVVVAVALAEQLIWVLVVVVVDYQCQSLMNFEVQRLFVAVAAAAKPVVEQAWPATLRVEDSSVDEVTFVVDRHHLVVTLKVTTVDTLFDTVDYCRAV